MSWRITWDGAVTDSDDFTIADLGYAERLSGTPWSVANAFREVAVARAFLAVVMRRAGVPEKEIPGAVDAVPMRQLKRAFEWVDDDGEGVGETEELDPSAPAPSSTTGDSSPTGSGGGSPRV